MVDYVITLTPEQEKAMLWGVISLQEWAENAVFNRARQFVDELCELAVEDSTHTILTLDEKRLFRDYLDANDIVLTSVQQLPLNIKAQIVAAARVKSAAERTAEAEAAMDKVEP